MKTIVTFFIAVILVAAAASYFSMRWSCGCSSKPASYAAEPHEWLHDQLSLTPDQHRAMEPIEQRYAARRAALVDRLRVANRNLGRILGEEKSYSPKVSAAVETIHHSQGELQKATLEHVFEMRRILTPEQGDKLLKMAEQALEDCP